MSADLQDKVRSLVVPLDGRRLLVPNVAVAEIVPYRAPQPVEDAPSWLLGMLEWRGLELALISYEAACGAPRPVTGPQSRIAVFNTLSGEGEPGFYALLTAGIPHLVKLAEGEVQSDPAPAAVLELARVHLQGDAAVIPDLDALERLVAELPRRAA
ncbi:chemotaxis protein CheW [Thiohalobacter sp. IOR34]|uniref:chemotaxis protein CheW n=1 Tax=Thiohalobacter sp. IOR34 TaxID=3057176 RepID=UPI0025AF8779|nr:chemotaxis protein CheW [Thiohalobacter sp. IOR34]WJW75798.1 chemotaxis protein CheW [Thiohalobacter sp. IOR34]